MAAKKSVAKGRTRTRNLTLRIDPIVHYLSEVASRRQRRSLTSFILQAMEDALNREIVGTRTIAAPPGVTPNSTIEDAHGDVHPPVTMEGSLFHPRVVKELWHPEEAIRIALLGLFDERLLNHEESLIWMVISEAPIFWKHYTQGCLCQDDLKHQTLRKLYPQVKKVAFEGASPDILVEA